MSRLLRRQDGDFDFLRTHVAIWRLGSLIEFARSQKEPISLNGSVSQKSS